MMLVAWHVRMQSRWTKLKPFYISIHVTIFILKHIIMMDYIMRKAESIIITLLYLCLLIVVVAFLAIIRFDNGPL